MDLLFPGRNYFLWPLFLPPSPSLHEVRTDDEVAPSSCLEVSRVGRARVDGDGVGVAAGGDQANGGGFAQHGRRLLP